MARVQVQVPVEPKQADRQVPESHVVTVPRIGSRKALYIGGVLLVIIVLGVLINDRNNLKNELKKESSSQAQNDNQKFQNEVAKLVHVPAGVTPTVKTPTSDELTKLINQNALYKNAKADDVFLVYNNPDKSIFLVIYRSSTHKIVLAVLDTSQQSNQADKPKP